jgi:ankyrin repeat protein
MRYLEAKLEPGQAKELVEGVWVQALTTAEEASLTALVNFDESTIANPAELATLLATRLTQEAVGGNDNEALTRALARNPDLGARDATGWPPLHNAIVQANVRGVELLLAANPPMDATTGGDRTALAVAGGPESTLAIAAMVYQSFAARGHVLTNAETEALREKLYRSFTAGMKGLLCDAFVSQCGHAPAVDLSVGAVTTQLSTFLGGLYDRVSTAVGTARDTADGLDESQRRLLSFAVADLGQLRVQALADHVEGAAETLRWLGHVADSEGKVNLGTAQVKLSEWSPIQALWYQCAAIQRLHGRSEDEGRRGFLTAELGNDAFAFARAAELYLVEKWFMTLDHVGPTAAALATRYATLALAGAGHYRFPAGTRTHATYLSVLSRTGSDVTEVTHHNLGIAADRHHYRPDPPMLYPYAVSGVNAENLAGILSVAIDRFVRVGPSGSADALGDLYTTMAAHGTVVGNDDLRTRFRPILQQVSNNCAVANLRSARMAYAVQQLGTDCDTLLALLVRSEVSDAQAQAVTAVDRTPLDPTVPDIVAIGQLRTAVYRGDADTVSELLRISPRCLTVRDETGGTLLHLAAALRQAMMSKALLAGGVAPLAIDGNGRTAIQLCARTAPMVAAMRPYYERKIQSAWLSSNETPCYNNPELTGAKITSLFKGNTFLCIGEIPPNVLRVLLFDDEENPTILFLKNTYVEKPTK